MRDDYKTKIKVWPHVWKIIFLVKYSVCNFIWNYPLWSKIQSWAVLFSRTDSIRSQNRTKRSLFDSQVWMTFNFPSRWPNITIKLGSFAVNVPCMFTIVRLSQGVLGLENKLKKAHQHWEGLKEMNYVNYSRKLCFIYKKQLSPWFTCTVSAMSSIHCSFSPWDAAATIRALLPS